MFYAIETDTTVNPETGDETGYVLRAYPCSTESEALEEIAKRYRDKFPFGDLRGNVTVTGSYDTGRVEIEYRYDTIERPDLHNKTFARCVLSVSDTKPF